MATTTVTTFRGGAVVPPPPRVPSQRSAAGGVAGGAAGGAQERTRGVFVTPESLTFPAAAAVCVALLSGAELLVRGAGTDRLWALGVCLLVGAVVVAAGWPSGQVLRGRQAVVHLAVGLLNTGLLFVSVVGVTSASALAA